MQHTALLHDYYYTYKHTHITTTTTNNKVLGAGIISFATVAVRPAVNHKSISENQHVHLLCI